MKSMVTVLAVSLVSSAAGCARAPAPKKGGAGEQTQPSENVSCEHLRALVAGVALCGGGHQNGPVAADPATVEAAKARLERGECEAGGAALAGDFSKSVKGKASIEDRLSTEERIFVHAFLSDYDTVMSCMPPTLTAIPLSESDYRLELSRDGAYAEGLSFDFKLELEPKDRHEYHIVLKLTSSAEQELFQDVFTHRSAYAEVTFEGSVARFRDPRVVLKGPAREPVLTDLVE